MPKIKKNSKNNYLPFICCLLISIIFSILPVCAQEPAEKSGSDYLTHYSKGEYTEAQKILSEKLASAYNSRAIDQKIPTDYIYIKKEEDRKNIDDLFRKRKIRRFFIEENQELFNLHLYSARCSFKLGDGDASLNHYFESLRYNQSDNKKNEIVFYEISQVYKSLNHPEAYARSLETAYSLNTTNFEYSLELGKALSKTKEKKKAIFHLKRYMESKGDDIADYNLFLMLGNLYEDIGEYLETARYYKKYLNKKNDDGYVNFALGYLAFKITGDHKLALDCFEKSVKFLPEKELFRLAKAAEYQADIYMHDLEYEKAIQLYLETNKYHDKIQTDIEENDKKISGLNDEILAVKSAMKTEKLFELYDRYEKLNREKGRLEFETREMNYEFTKINAGRIKWNLALSHERLEKPEEAIHYYSEAISFDYNSNQARDKIKKLKLKIQRGY